jgi:DNA-binding response OmpR family regulator
MGTSVYRILIHAPEARAARGLVAVLTTVGCTAVRCLDAADLIARLDHAEADAVVICPTTDGEGLDVLDRVVADFPEVPALVAAPADALDLHVQGLERGAVDYLIQPCNGDEALTRIATALHRAVAMRRARPRRKQGLQFDQDSGRLGDGARWTMLTPTERLAFSLLFRHGNRPVSKDRLKSAIALEGVVSDNAVEVLIHRLRAKACTLGVHIRTYRGAGYVLERA